MSILGALEIAGIAIKAVDKLIDMFPNYEQKKIQKWNYLKDTYEIECKKPRYNPEGTPAENYHARSEDRMLNLRDKCMRYGEALVAELGSAKG